MITASSNPALGWIFSSDLVRRRALTSIGRDAIFNIVGWPIDLRDEKQWMPIKTIAFNTHPICSEKMA